jgi:hypothetical protein
LLFEVTLTVCLHHYDAIGYLLFEVTLTVCRKLIYISLIMKQ